MRSNPCSHCSSHVQDHRSCWAHCLAFSGCQDAFPWSCVTSTKHGMPCHPLLGRHPSCPLPEACRSAPVTQELHMMACCCVEDGGRKKRMKHLDFVSIRIKSILSSTKTTDVSFVDEFSHSATDVIKAFTIFQFKRQAVKTNQKCDWGASLAKTCTDEAKQRTQFGGLLDAVVGKIEFVDQPMEGFVTSEWKQNA
jgi:hypothetical protein